MNENEIEEIDELMCRARAIVNITMENLSQNRESDDDIEYALWAASGLLSQAIELLNKPPKRSNVGKDELAVQDEGRIVYFDEILPEDRIDVRVSPEGVTLTTKGEAA